MEALEARRVPAQFGVPWHDAQHLSLSFVPDGTPIAAQRSDLFRALDARMPTAAWQGEILRAFQTWAVAARLNFAVEADGGQPLGVPGPNQADSRFGDIRIAARPMSPEVLSISVPHDPFLSGTWSGDVLLNSAAAIEGDALFPVLLHEVGHVLGLEHSLDPESVMASHLDRRRTALAPGDVAAVRDLYGPRLPDRFEGAGGNGAEATATPLPAPSGFDGTTPLMVYGDVASPGDVDVFSLRPPAGVSGPATIRLQTAGVSLLTPRLTVSDATGAVLGDVASRSGVGDTLQVRLPAIDPDGAYFLAVRGATEDVFGVGEYALAVTFDARSTIGPDELDPFVRQTYSYLGAADIVAIFRDPRGVLFRDDRHADDTLRAPSALAPIRSYGARTPYRAIASVGDADDIDVYRFRTPAIAPDLARDPLVMTVLVRATEVNGIQPLVAVLDGGGEPVPALVLARGGGSFTIQVADARPDADYFLRVAPDPASGRVVGNYDLEVHFGRVAARPITFVGATLGPTMGQAAYRLVVNQTQLFHLLLGASDASPGAAVRMTLVDDRGRAVASRRAGAGETAGGLPLLLAPGAYRATFTAEAPGGDRPPPMAFRLFGASLSDPIGPAPDDPTLAPIARPTPGDPRASFASPLGSRDVPYFWMALGLDVPRGPEDRPDGPAGRDLAAPSAHRFRGPDVVGIVAEDPGGRAAAVPRGVPAQAPAVAAPDDARTHPGDVAAIPPRTPRGRLGSGRESGGDGAPGTRPEPAGTGIRLSRDVPADEMQPATRRPDPAAGRPEPGAAEVPDGPASSPARAGQTASRFDPDGALLILTLAAIVVHPLHVSGACRCPRPIRPLQRPPPTTGFRSGT